MNISDFIWEMNDFIFEMDRDADYDFDQFVANSWPHGLDRGHATIVKGSCLRLSPTIWEQHLFGPIVEPLIVHLQTVIRKVKATRDEYGKSQRLNHLLMAGGLAQNEYFQHRINEALGMDSEHTLAIHIPQGPILSILDGALKLDVARPNYVTMRRARFTYGIDVDRAARNVDLSKLPDGYLEKNSFFHPNARNRKVVRNLFRAIIRKNDPVCWDEPIEREYKRYHEKEQTLTLTLYYSEHSDPYIIEDAGTWKLGAVRIAFPIEYEFRRFTVHFFFGDTTIKVKAYVVHHDESVYLGDANIDFGDR